MLLDVLVVRQPLVDADLRVQRLQPPVPQVPALLPHQIFPPLAVALVLFAHRLVFEVRVLRFLSLLRVVRVRKQVVLVVVHILSLQRGQVQVFHPLNLLLRCPQHFRIVLSQLTCL